MRRNKPVSDIIYHIYNRGVEKRTTFIDNRDRLRFIKSLYFFNDNSPSIKQSGVGLPIPEKDAREPLVELMAFCLMPNHYHLMLRGITENGVTEFMRKLGTGYTNYFNLRHKRVGALFQGKFKAIPVLNDSHLNWLPHYIHCNPHKNESGSRTSDIEKYVWSSYGEYTRKRRYQEIVDISFLNEFFETPEHFKKETREWLKAYRSNKDTHELALD